MSKYTYNDKFFENIDNESKAYWLGFLYADGCITRFYRNEKLKAMSLELTLKSEDKSHLEKFLNDLEANVPIQKKTVKLNNKKYNANRVVINCTKMCRDLIALGCTPQKSLTLAFPSLDIVPEHLVNHFVRGYFDGDGCVFYKDYRLYGGKQRTHIVGFVGTFSFLTSLLEVINLNYEIHQKSGQKAYQVNLGSYDAFVKMYDYMYKNATVYLGRKKTIFDNALNIKIDTAV